MVQVFADENAAPAAVVVVSRKARQPLGDRTNAFVSERQQLKMAMALSSTSSVVATVEPAEPEAETKKRGPLTTPVRATDDQRLAAQYLQFASPITPSPKAPPKKQGRNRSPLAKKAASKVQPITAAITITVATTKTKPVDSWVMCDGCSSWRLLAAKAGAGEWTGRFECAMVGRSCEERPDDADSPSPTSKPTAGAAAATAAAAARRAPQSDSGARAGLLKARGTVKTTLLPAAGRAAPAVAGGPRGGRQEGEVPAADDHDHHGARVILDFSGVDIEAILRRDEAVRNPQLDNIKNCIAPVPRDWLELERPTYRLLAEEAGGGGGTSDAPSAASAAAGGAQRAEEADEDDADDEDDEDDEARTALHAGMADAERASTALRIGDGGMLMCSACGKWREGAGDSPVSSSATGGGTAESAFAASSASSTSAASATGVTSATSATSAASAAASEASCGGRAAPFFCGGYDAPRAYSCSRPCGWIVGQVGAEDAAVFAARGIHVPDDLLDKAPGLLQELQEGGPVSRLGQEAVELVECMGLLGTQRAMDAEGWGQMIEPFAGFLEGDVFADEEEDEDEDEASSGLLEERGE